jgi:hypothetical protein
MYSERSLVSNVPPDLEISQIAISSIDATDEIIE